MTEPRKPTLGKVLARDLSLPMKAVVRPRPDYSNARPKIHICVNKRDAPLVSCGSRGGSAVHDLVAAAVCEQRIDADVEPTHCLGTCDKGPSIRISPNNSWFYGAHAADVPEITSALKAAVEEYAVQMKAEGAD